MHDILEVASLENSSNINDQTLQQTLRTATCSEVRRIVSPVVPDKMVLSVQQAMQALTKAVSVGSMHTQEVVTAACALAMINRLLSVFKTSMQEYDWQSTRSQVKRR